MSVNKPTLRQKGQTVKSDDEPLKWWQIVLGIAVVVYWCYSVAWVGAIFLRG